MRPDTTMRRAGETEARVREGRIRHRRQRQRHRRRRRDARRHDRGEREEARTRSRSAASCRGASPGAIRRSWESVPFRRRRSRCRRPALKLERHRPDRDQRSVRGPDPRRRERARHRPGEAQRQRRRDRARPSARGIGHASAAHAAVRAAPPQGSVTVSPRRASAAGRESP